MNKQQLESISNDKPKGATHVASKNSKLEVFLYYKWHKLDLYFTWTREGWSDDYRPIDLIHNLSDLQTQLNQLNEIERLKSKIDELEKENAELKTHVNQQQTNLDRLWHLAEDLGACSEYLKVNFASGSYIPKQSLAQHDKEVAVKALMDFRKYLDEQEFKAVQKAVINKYAEQLQEQS